MHSCRQWIVGYISDGGIKITAANDVTTWFNPLHPALFSVIFLPFKDRNIYIYICYLISPHSDGTGNWNTFVHESQGTACQPKVSIAAADGLEHKTLSHWIYLRKRKTYFHILSYLNTEQAQLWDILPHGRQGHVYPTLSIPWILVAWRRQDPGHQQPWYCLITPRVFQPSSQHQKDWSLIVHYSDAIMSTMASEISTVCSTVSSGADKKNQSSTSLAFVRRIHRWPMDSPHKEPVTRKMFPCDVVIVYFNVCENVCSV